MRMNPLEGAAAGTSECYVAPAAGVGQDYHNNGAGGGRRRATTAGGTAGCFGPSAPEVEVTPRFSRNHDLLKPHTGMTIRLTPEILNRLKEPGPKPEIELVLKSADEGGPVLIVGGASYDLDAHQMAVGSEVHIVARTQQSGSSGSFSGKGKGRLGEGDRAAVMAGAGGTTGKPRMTVLASLHRKLIVQQVLTEAKRAEIRARKDEIERQEKRAKKNVVRMEDQEEMLAAAESIPVPVGRTQALLLQQQQQQQEIQQRAGGTGVGRPGAAAGNGEDNGGGDWGERRRGRRDPLTAWVYDCFNHDHYDGHVSDLRRFLKGIDFHHIMFRYHVHPDGTLGPDRRRFCVKFKTKAGRDLAIKRSGEALGSYCSWWDPENVVVVARGRDEDGGSGGGRLNDLLLVLPQGSSVADVLEKVKERLPQDLTPALLDRQTGGETSEKGNANGGNERRIKLNNDTDNDDDDGDYHNRRCPQQEPWRRNQHRTKLEAYRRDMLRAALGASLSEALALGDRRGAPVAAARVAGTDDDNARRVATLAAAEAATQLDSGVEGAKARGDAMNGRRNISGSGGDGGKRKEREGRGGQGLLPSGPVGGARAQRRRQRGLLLHATEGGSER